MNRFRVLLIAFLLMGVLGLAGCASGTNDVLQEPPPTHKKSDPFDKEKVFKKDKENDDMERLD